MSLYGVELSSLTNRLVLETRLKLSSNKTGPNIRNLYRSLAKRDQQLTGVVHLEAFEKALNQNGLFWKKSDFQGFQKAYQVQGGVNWFQFLKHVREPMSPLRRKVVEEIFDSLSSLQPKIPLETLHANYNENVCDAFQKISSKKIIKFETFVSQLNVQENAVTREQFIAYYDDINVNFQSDQNFVRFACLQWNLPIKKIEGFNPEEIKEVLKGLRFKLIQKTQGTKDEFLLQKAFEQFDINKNYSIGAYELDMMLKKIGLPVQARLITPLLQKLDKNKSGAIQYEQFRRFIFFDPFLQ